jgi:hypothetical protein
MSFTVAQTKIDEHGALINECPTEEWSVEALLDHCIVSQSATFFGKA